MTVFAELLGVSTNSTLISFTKVPINKSSCKVGKLIKLTNSYEIKYLYNHVTAVYQSSLIFSWLLAPQLFNVARETLKSWEEPEYKANFKAHFIKYSTFYVTLLQIKEQVKSQGYPFGSFP